MGVTLGLQGSLLGRLSPSYSLFIFSCGACSDDHHRRGRVDGLGPPRGPSPLRDTAVNVCTSLAVMTCTVGLLAF